MDKEEFIKELEYFGYTKISEKTFTYGKTSDGCTTVIVVVGLQLDNVKPISRYYVTGESYRDMECGEIIKDIKSKGFYSKKIKREEKINNILQSSY